MEFNGIGPPRNTHPNTSYGLQFAGGNYVMNENDGFSYVRSPPSSDMDHWKCCSPDRSNAPSDEAAVEIDVREMRTRVIDLLDELSLKTWGKPLNCKHVETLIFDGRNLLREPDVITEVDRHSCDGVINLSCEKTSADSQYGGDGSVQYEQRASNSDVLRSLQEDYNQKERLIDVKRHLLNEKEQQLLLLERIIDEKLASLKPIMQLRNRRHNNGDTPHGAAQLYRADDEKSVKYRTTTFGRDVINLYAAQFESQSRCGERMLHDHVEEVSYVPTSGQAEPQPIRPTSGTVNPI